MVAIYTHSACLDHDTGPGHAEHPARLKAVTAALCDAFRDALEWHEAPRAQREQLLRVHTPELLARVLDTQPTQRIMLDPDTVLSPASAEAALRVAGAAIAAVDRVLCNDMLSGGMLRAFCAVRPPGHHATTDTAMGFCLFNGIAVAAAHAIDAYGLERVTVIDFDVHHGNGTQAIFAQEPRVQYLSSHQMPLYPGTGDSDEHGVGNVVNAPLPPGADSDVFRSVWREHLLPALDAFGPQLLLVSAGFDAHLRDPLAQLQLQAEDFTWVTRELVVLAEQHAQGRIVSVLEGGYDLQALAECSVAHVGALLPR